MRLSKLKARKQQANIVDYSDPNVVFVPPTEPISQSFDDEYREKQTGYRLNGFNQFLSDRLPLRRVVPDSRHDTCRCGKCMLSARISTVKMLGRMIAGHSDLECMIFIRQN